jgi:hypothetical protein
MTSTLPSPPPTSSPQSAIGNQQSAIQNGWVETFYRSYKGRRLGPYHVRKWKAGNRVHREYIKPADVEKIKTACQTNREERKTRSEAGKREIIYVDNSRYLLRMMRKLDRDKPVRPEDALHIQKIHREGCYALGRPKLRRPNRRPIFPDLPLDDIVSLIYSRLASCRNSKFLNPAPPNIQIPKPTAQSHPFMGPCSTNAQNTEVPWPEAESTQRFMGAQFTNSPKATRSIEDFFRQRLNNPGVTVFGGQCK